MITTEAAAVPKQSIAIPTPFAEFEPDGLMLKSPTAAPTAPPPTSTVDPLISETVEAAFSEPAAAAPRAGKIAPCSTFVNAGN